MFYQDIDYKKLWLEHMGWNAKKRDTRQFIDEIERDFWKMLAPKYTTEYNLNNDTRKIADKLQNLLGVNQEILEIGCGTGNFTILMSLYAKKIIGIDFSKHMLRELSKKCKLACTHNISLINSKWEDFKEPLIVDYIVSINSLYRIKDIETALLKMDKMVKKGVIIVRTIQESFFAPLYRKYNLNPKSCIDYKIMPNILWQKGIHAKVDFVEYTRNRYFDSMEAIELEIRKDLSDYSTHDIDDTLKFLMNKLNIDYLKSDKYKVVMPRTTVFIYWNKN